MTTRFGRVPLWLYESGVTLQAIATYGWLAGRYGHYSKINPSYGTLAAELGISRGSVITHVNALIKVGAVRFVEKGVDNQTTNTYEIAFERPFPTEAQVNGGQNTDQSDQDESGVDGEPQVEGGQPTDHPAEVVSPLTGGGQNADQGGQRAVHDIDVLKKTKPTPPPPSSPEPADPAAEGEQEEVDADALQPHPDALAVIAAVDLGGKPLVPKSRAEAERILTAKLAEGWTVPSLNKAFEGCVDGAYNPPGAFMSRVQGLGAPPVRAPIRASPKCPDCDGRGLIEDDYGNPTPCPSCKPPRSTP